MAVPPAEIDIDEGLVRALLSAQHPDLAGLALDRIDSGWDNAVWRLGESLLVRLPQRAMAAPLARIEQRWLPILAPTLTLPVPTPLRVGRPAAGYPWHWSIVPWFEGTPGDRATLTHPLDAAERLGRFLRALHHRAPADAPCNPYRSVPLGEREATFAARLALVGASIDVASATEAWERAVNSDPWDAPPTWVHGDLHPANTIVSGGTLSAVVDFGDLCAGDPATDLAAAWLLLPGPAVDRCLGTYGAVTPGAGALLRRSLGWTVLLALMLIEISLTDKPTYGAIGRAALRKVDEHARRS